MAISCGKCGRQYDSTLFQFGKTINCACGERVGFENRIVLPNNAELRFFADVMVSRLVRWLRALGIDTIWEDRIADGDLVRRALAEHRWILTLDKGLPEEWRVGNVLLLKSEEPLEQLREIAERFRLEMPGKLFTRCLICNTELRPAKENEIVELVPENIRQNQIDFRFCQTCAKVYWNGSHTDRMKTAIESVLKRE